MSVICNLQSQNKIFTNNKAKKSNSIINRINSR